MFQISVVNYSTAISEREMHRVVRAINRQIAEDFEPYWAFGGRLRIEGPAGRRSTETSLKELRGDAIIFVVDTVKDVADRALGYHTRNQLGVPVGYVFLDLCKELGDDWSTTLSHEALELIADPQCNLMALGPHPVYEDRQVYHYFEMCDAVQSQAYEIDGVIVSNFVLPHYFTEDEEDAARNDFCGTGLRSFDVNAGGYIGFYDPVEGRQDQYFADSRLARQRFATKLRSESGRVMLRTSQWKQAFEPATRNPKAKLSASAAPKPGSTGPVADPIKHVVVLMLENRSFDHMLGGLTTFDPTINGVPMPPGSNIDSRTNKAYIQEADASPTIGPRRDLPHEFIHVRQQIHGTDLRTPMGGFVDAYREAHPNASAADLKQDLPQLMAYFKEDDLPVLHALAKQFLICDNWFSSMPGPTWPNRFFVHSGTSLGDMLMPTASLDGIRMFFGRYSQPTIFGQLSQKGLPWRIYHDSIPQTIVLNELKDDFFFSNRYRLMKRFRDDCAVPEADFPAYTFIEPRYFKGLGKPQNDQHPPASIHDGEALIAEVYEAIRANQKLWESTLLIVTYDEHGGFYDHVTPPETVAPDNSPFKGFQFNQLGVRVPTLLISPWVDRAVDKTCYDHTSILRYLWEKWDLPRLSERANPKHGVLATGNFVSNILPVMRTNLPRLPAPAARPVAMAAAMAPPLDADTPLDDTQAALVLYAEQAREEHAMRSMKKLPDNKLAARAQAAQPATMQQRASRVEAWMEDVTQSHEIPKTAVPIAIGTAAEINVEGVTTDATASATEAATGAAITVAAEVAAVAGAKAAPGRPRAPAAAKTRKRTPAARAGTNGKKPPRHQGR